MRNLLTFWNLHKNTWGHFLWMGIVILFLGSIIVCTGHSITLVVLMVCVEIVQFDRHAYTVHREGVGHPILRAPLSIIPIIAMLGMVISGGMVAFHALKTPRDPTIGLILFLGGQMNASRFIHRIQHENIFDYRRQDEAAFFECLGAIATLVSWSVGVHILID